MPPKIKVTKENIVQAGFDIVREKGIEYLNARAIGVRAHCSTQPIFSSFKSMSELIVEIKKKAFLVYESYIQEWQMKEKPFKAVGLGYIDFASKEGNLFKILFMDETDSSTKNLHIDRNMDEFIDVICKNTGLNRENARLLYLQSWILSHGIATLMVTKTMEFDEKTISNMLAYGYKGTLEVLKKEGN